jgi:tRNA (cytidine/uridine-2'-O-)-methyltransferase
MRIVLFEPEIPQNTGSIIRSASCFGFSVHMVEPFGFIFSDRKLKRSSMDYADDVRVSLYTSWDDFIDKKDDGRMLLLTPHTDTLHDTFDYLATDYLIMGKESSGVPENVSQMCDIKLRIPMISGKRSLNVAVSAGIVMSSMMRSVSHF